MKIEFKNLENGEVAYERTLLPSQEKFWNSTSRNVLFSGGYGCGKSMILIFKTIYDAMRQDNNYILMGRKTYGEIHDVLLKDFFEICHPTWVHSFKKTPHPSVVLNTFNGKTSEIIFRNLDKFSENEIAGLNLGGVSIDQIEDVPENIFMALKGRLRRVNKVTGDIEHRVYATANPAPSWVFRVFLENKDNVDTYELIEASTLENEKNLPEGYIKDLKSYPPLLYQQFVIGKYDPSIFVADNAVFAREHLKKLHDRTRDPRQVKEGLHIYKKFKKGHRYQMGVDSAEGAEPIDEKYRNQKKDRAVIVIVDMDEEEEVATFSGRTTPGATAEKAVLFASWYDNPLAVVEMNSMGLAVLNRMQELGYTNLYRRMEFEQALNKRLKKVGFRTTKATKSLLIQRFNNQLRHGNPKIYSRVTIEEMRTFVFSDIGGSQGASAQEGYHDDHVMATLLAFYEDRPYQPGQVSGEKHDTIPGVDTVPSVEVKDGKWRPPKHMRPEVQVDTSYIS